MIIRLLCLAEMLKYDNCVLSFMCVFSSLSASQTSEDKDESTKESGYSESESSTSCLSEAASISLGDSVPEGQISTKIHTKNEKDVLAKENLREKNRTFSSSNREPKVISKKKPVEKKGMYFKHHSLPLYEDYLKII